MLESMSLLAWNLQPNVHLGRLQISQSSKFSNANLAEFIVINLKLVAQNIKVTEARGPTQTHCMWTTLSHVPGSQTPGGWSSQSETLVSGEPSEEPWMDPWCLWDNASKVFSHTSTAAGTRIANFATFLQCERG